MGARKSILVAPSMGGYRIDHAYGETRRQAQEYLRRWHYLASDGNQGFMFAIVADDNTVAGACLVGNAMSENQERDLVVGACLVGQSNSPDIEADLVTTNTSQRPLIQQVKRSHIRDEVPVEAVCESKRQMALDEAGRHHPLSPQPPSGRGSVPHRSGDQGLGTLHSPARAHLDRHLHPQPLHAEASCICVAPALASPESGSPRGGQDLG